MLTKQQLAFLKNKLTKRQLELNEQIKENEHFGMQASFPKDAVGELSNYDNHPGDYGTEEFERGKDLALNEHAKQELMEIEQALEAMMKGSYGVCQTCHQPIPFERLEAVPTATRCIEHATEQAISEKRPVEDVEGFLLSNKDGDVIGVNEQHEEYEDYLDNQGISSLFGDHGIIGVKYGDELEEE